VLTRDLIAVDAKSRVRQRCPKRLERGPRRLDEDDRPLRRSRDRVEARAAGFGDPVASPTSKKFAGKSITAASAMRNRFRASQR